MSITADLLVEVETFLRKHDMPATTFGLLACRDPHVVRWLREGRGVTSGRIDKLRAFMSAYAPVQDGKPRPRATTEAAA